jgi:hypothetical protein
MGDQRRNILRNAVEAARLAARQTRARLQIALRNLQKAQDDLSRVRKLPD